MAIELQDIILKTPSPTYNDVVNNGPNILPQRVIQLYDDTEWEEFTEECTHSLKNKYKLVRRAGGAGDQGIDIAAFQTDMGFEGEWDNYQCKHYGHALRPTDAYLELGKLCYYTFKKEYSVPQNYFFVAPKGVGTSLSKLIRNNSDELKRLLISEWPKYCEKKITSKENVPLENELLKYVENFDFSIVKDISVVELLDIHRDTPYFHHRFGGGLPSRPSPENPPEDIAENEAIYIQKLLDAYAEFLNKESCDINELNNHGTLQQSLVKLVTYLRKNYPFLETWMLSEAQRCWGNSILVFSNVDFDRANEFKKDLLAESEDGKFSAPPRKFKIVQFDTLLPPLAGGITGLQQNYIKPINGHFVSEHSILYLASFLLSSLVRYRPEIWVHSINGRRTNERGNDDRCMAMIEKFLGDTLAAFPGFVKSSLETKVTA